MCTIVTLLITDQLSAIVAETEMPGVLCVSLSRTGSHKSHRTDKTDQHVGNTDRCKYNEKYKYKQRQIQKEDSKYGLITRYKSHGLCQIQFDLTNTDKTSAN